MKPRTWFKEQAGLLQPDLVVSRPQQSTPRWTLVAARWARKRSRPRGGERRPAALYQGPPQPDSCGAEPQGGCRAGDAADRQGEPRSGTEAGPAGRLPGQTEGAGGWGGAAAASVARRLVGLDPNANVCFFSDFSSSPVFHILSPCPPASEGPSRCWCRKPCSTSWRKDAPMMRCWRKRRSKRGTAVRDATATAFWGQTIFAAATSNCVSEEPRRWNGGASLCSTRWTRSTARCRWSSCVV